MTTILNLGCGARTSPDCVNIDWSPALLIKNNPALKLISRPFLDRTRRERMDALTQNIRVHNLRRGIPYADQTVDGVFHSHVLEHIDRDQVSGFLKEIYRVLKPGGVHRIVVPDMELLARKYLNHVEECSSDPSKQPDHDRYIDAILEQCVRREAAATRKQSSLQRLLENTLLGDARKRGETHQWMYDFHNLSALLKECGFEQIRRTDHTQTSMQDWHRSA